MPIASHRAYQLLLEALLDEPEPYAYHDKNKKAVVVIQVYLPAHVALVVGTDPGAISDLVRDPENATPSTKTSSRLKGASKPSGAVSGPLGSLKGKTRLEVFFAILGCDKTWFDLDEKAFKARLADLQAVRNARRLGLADAGAIEPASPAKASSKASGGMPPSVSISPRFSPAAANASPWDKLSALSLVVGRDKIDVEVVDLEKQIYNRKTWRPPPGFSAGEHRGNPRGAPVAGHTIPPSGPGDDDREIPPVLLGLQGVDLHLRGFSSYKNRACAVFLRTGAGRIVNFLPWHATERFSSGVVVPAVKETKIKDKGTLKIEIDPSPLFGIGKTVSVFVFVHQIDLMEAYRSAPGGNGNLFQKQFPDQAQLDQFAIWFSKEHAERRAALCGASYHQGWPETDDD